LIVYLIPVTIALISFCLESLFPSGESGDSWSPSYSFLTSSEVTIAGGCAKVGGAAIIGGAAIWGGAAIAGGYATVGGWARMGWLANDGGFAITGG
jgi:hypothetical protein